MEEVSSSETSTVGDESQSTFYSTNINIAPTSSTRKPKNGPLEPKKTNRAKLSLNKKHTSNRFDLVVQSYPAMNTTEDVWSPLPIYKGNIQLSF